MSEGLFQADYSATKLGSAWYCNACPYSDHSHERAVQHAVESKDGNFPHALYERDRAPQSGETVQKGATRRIVVYADGRVLTERPNRSAPRRPTKDPAAPTRGRARRRG